MRLVIAECSADYTGRLTAHLPRATRLLLLKVDGSVLLHSDGGSYKPLNWMGPPTTCHIVSAENSPENLEMWTFQSVKSDDRLVIHVYRKLHDSSHELGLDPGLVKRAVEAELQQLVADHIEVLGEGFTLIRREHRTAIGPVDLLARDASGQTVAIELKRRGEIDGVEQVSRYRELLNHDPLLSPVRAMLAAQSITPQAQVLARHRGIECRLLDYEALSGQDDTSSRLF